MPMLAELVDLVIGVDTHTDTHTAAVLDARSGAVLDTVTITTDPHGYAELVTLVDQHGGTQHGETQHGETPTGRQYRQRGGRAWAIEGAGGYGAGLTRHLAAGKETIVELDRPARPARRSGRKSDAIDAERAARDALARTRLAQPKTGHDRAALQTLLTARRSAVAAATDAQRQLRALIINAAEPVAARFRGPHGRVGNTRALLEIATRLRPGANNGDIETITQLSVLHTLAHRIRSLETEATAHEKAIRAIVTSWRPDLLDLPGVGPINAATVLTAWSHPGRCRNDSAFAMLAGAAPIPASSGRTVRYRLNRAGNRQLNQALHTIAVCRQRYHQPTRDYTDKRQAQGKTDREIRRCLKRYIARQLYRQLELDNP